jgi:hypothetical protein
VTVASTSHRYSVMPISDHGLVWFNVRILFPRDQLPAVAAALETAGGSQTGPTAAPTAEGTNHHE